MKKCCKYISILLILLVTVFGSVFVASDEKVSAITSGFEGEDRYFVKPDGDGNYVKISQKGMITIQYKYGFAELMIIVSKCTRYNEGRTGCLEFAKGEKRNIIHVGGEKYTAAKDNGNQHNSKNIHLYNYFEYGEILNVEIIVEFIKTDAPTNFKYLFYDYDSTNCGEVAGGVLCYARKSPPIENSNTMTTHARALSYICNLDWKESYFKNNSDFTTCASKNLTNIETIGTYIYGNGISDEYTNARHDWINSHNTRVGDVISISVDNSKVDEGSENVDSLIYDTIIPTMIIVLFILAGITIAVLGHKIVKSSDEPQERQEAIKRLRNILIGLVFALLVLFALEPLVKLVSGLIEK